MPFAGRADFAYGNTRLRARRASLLGASDYEALADKDLEGLLGSLSSTPYRSEVEHATAHFSGLRRLHEALRRHLARVLEEMRSFYGDGARSLVDVLLSRWDRQNLILILRGQARGADVDQILANVVPIGGLDEAAIQEVAGQDEFGRAVELLVSWRLPDPEMAHALARAWPEYARTEDLAALEQRVIAEHLRRNEETLSRFGRDAGALVEAVRREVDARNLVTALRLRRSIESEELDPARAGDADGLFLPGGTIPPARLDEATLLDAQGAASMLGQATGDARWGDTLERWTAEGDLAALEDDLDREVTRASIRLFADGDPLSVAVPVAFVAAKENEVRNLRLLGEGTAHGVSSEELDLDLMPA
jgi:vacuolar-type H+-ATPase subunit C/Vma6